MDKLHRRLDERHNHAESTPSRNMINLTQRMSQIVVNFVSGYVTRLQRFKG